MKQVPIHTAKAQLSSLIARACAGESVVISKGKKPVVRLVPVAGVSGRQFGSMRGLARVTDAFFEPLPPEELDAWGQ
ncbi:MAG: type II toxin-antitoxin system prevent-host-death family antitoxin [Deltaproteobacteria bacterium]|nr:type II toxin-antitoxin system prevent-host-death family antitoxin [Deltaproteobacteria bacterium]